MVDQPRVFPKVEEEDPNIPNRLGDYLRRLREDRGLTQTQVADQSGIEQTMVSRYELRSGLGQIPPRKYLHRFADFYGVPETELLKQAGYIRETQALSAGKPENGHQLSHDDVRRRFEAALRDYRRLLDQEREEHAAPSEQMAMGR